MVVRWQLPIEFIKIILFWLSYFFYNFISHDFIFRPVVSEMGVFKLPINSFAISDQMFYVACYPWRVIRFDSYNFVRNRFVRCVKYNFWKVLYILIYIVISLDLKKEASFGQFFSVLIIICQFVVPNFLPPIHLLHRIKSILCYEEGGPISYEWDGP